MRRENLLRGLYERMFRHYGPLHWWPGETPFEVMVGAILTQNTAWTNVEKAIANLKRAKVLEPHKLFRLAPAKLAKLIRPAGFFRLKTKRLKNFLKFLIQECDGNISQLKRQPLHVLREKLLSVNGIGPETADSILLYALEKPIFVVDAYTRRVLYRHHLAKADVTYHEMQELFMRHLKPDASYFNEYHAQLVNIGKDFCRTKPRCQNCPLNGFNW